MGRPGLVESTGKPGWPSGQSIARIAVQDYTVPYPSTALRDFYEKEVFLHVPPGEGSRTHVG